MFAVQDLHMVAMPGSQRDSADQAGRHIRAQRAADRLELICVQS